MGKKRNKTLILILVLLSVPAIVSGVTLDIGGSHMEIVDGETFTLREIETMGDLYQATWRWNPSRNAWDLDRYAIETELAGSVGLYDGPGADSSCVAAAEAMCAWSGLDVTRLYPNDVKHGDLDVYDLILFPGGWAYSYWMSLAPSGTDNIRDYVAGGGSYMGICAGAFFAADTVTWEGSHIDYPLDLFPGRAEGPIDEIEPWPGFGMCGVSPVDPPPGSSITMEPAAVMYYGGPCFHPRPSSGVTVNWTYDAVSDPAMVSFYYGAGKVLLSGPHPEFEEDAERDLVYWDSPLDDQGSDWDACKNLLGWLVE